ncbi:MAG: YecR-like lipofamily protein [Desulfovibrio sp.]|nr:YecR-like lipofamily protein [Desulfovibrio sp.]
MKKIFIVSIICVLLCLCLFGCAKKVTKEWFAETGSRSDASVKMAYTYNPQTEIPIVAENQAIVIANKKCQAWGYERAEAFGGVVSRCTQMGPVFGGVGCVQMVVEADFQCLGKPSSSVPTPNHADGPMTSRRIKPR